MHDNKGLGLRQRAVAVAAAALFLAGQAVSSPAIAAPQRVELNQGWSKDEAEFYAHANEGTNIAPLPFLLNLPDPQVAGGKFLDRLTTQYGFIASAPSSLNPHGLPVGFAIDTRPRIFGDRDYVGITCSACHTRQLTYGNVVMPVHGGPALADLQALKGDLYDAFFALLEDDQLAGTFAQGVLGHAPTPEEIAALRDEIRAFTGPVTMARALLVRAQIPPADFGPGNLNALSQGVYNNAGLAAWIAGSNPAAPGGPPPVAPRFEGTVNLPSMWFAPADDWAQWFAEIHDAGPRNWIQSVSTWEVRPPKMTAAQGSAALITSIHFDNIAQIQESLERLRTPKWPEAVFGPLDLVKVEEGRALYEANCAQCHTRTRLPPNELGVVFKERPAFDVGTDPTAYEQFAADAANRVSGLQSMSAKIIDLRRTQLTGQFGEAIAANYFKMSSRGRPNQFVLATDDYRGSEEPYWPRSGAAYWASPLEGIFASSPYFHNGSVRNLWDVLTPPAQRPKTFQTGTTEFDVEAVGLRSEGRFLYDTAEPGKSNGGHPFGTDLAQEQKAALIEYLKSL
ncbi:MAG: di-heme-cytochrome C peroxidase [Geminicoccaceae bacterium]